MENATYLRNENLKTVKPGYPGNKFIDGQFANGDSLYHPALWDVLRWKLGKNPQKKEKDQDHFQLAVDLLPPGTFSAQNDTIIWLGHATFFVRLAGISLLIDPVLFDLPLIKRHSALPCPPEAISNLDFILLTHGHRDHLDERSLKLLVKNNPQVKVLAPLKMAALLKKMIPGVPVEEAGWFQQYSPELTQPLEIFYLPARHWFRRGLTDMNSILWGSFLIKHNQKSIYFAGDTALGPHFEEIKNLFGGPEICIMPIGAYKPPFLMQQSHLNPAEAVNAFQALGGQKFYPMHLGTFDLSDEPSGEPMRMLQNSLAATGLTQALIPPIIGKETPV